MAIQSGEPRVAAGLIGEDVRPASVGGRTKSEARSTMYPYSHEVGEGLTGVGRHFEGLGGAGTKDRGNVCGDVLEDRVGGGDCPEVATSAGEGYPGRRGVLASSGDHVELCVSRRRGRRVEDGVGPVGEGDSKAARAAGVEVAEAVGDWDAVLVGVDPGQSREDVVSSVRDQGRVMIREDDTIVLDEVQKAWYLFQVRRDVGVVPREVRIVERDVDYMLNLSVGGVEPAAAEPTIVVIAVVIFVIRRGQDSPAEAGNRENQYDYERDSDFA